MNGLELNEITELNEINKILNERINNKYLGKNVRSSVTGEVYHISDKGAIKYFENPYILSSTMGKNGCPANYITVNEDLTSETFLEENPTFFISSPMVITGENQGQSCNAGKNVFVDQLPSLETSSVGCFTSNSGILLGSEKTFEQCKKLAANEGYSMFSLNTTENNGTLYYGNNGTVTGDVYCKGGWGNTDYNIDKNMDCLYGINSLGDKISCSTGGVSMENNGFYCIPKNSQIKSTLVGNCYGFTGTENSTAYTETPYTELLLQLPLDSCTYVDTQWQNNMSGIASLTISPDGVYQLINQEGDTLISWTSPYSATQCSYGGGVNLSTLSATYGGSCTSQCSITPGNYTSNVVSLINNNSTSTTGTTANYPNLDNPSFNIGSAWEEYYGTGNASNTMGAGVDPCPGCSKDFTITYQCGSTATPVTTNVVASAEGTLISLPCETNYTACITAIGISDEGDIKILKDIYGTPEELFSICDTYKGNLVSLPSLLSMQQWVSMKNKITVTFNNKQYNMIYGPGQIVAGEFILSPTATCFLIITESIPIIGYFTEKLGCNSINTNFTGIDTMNSSPTTESINTKWCVDTRVNNGVVSYRTWGTLTDESSRNKWNSINCNTLSKESLPAPTSSVFAINQFTNPIFIGNYGKQGYVDDDMVLHEYSQDLMPTFTETPNSTISSGTVLKTVDYTSDEQCKVDCLKNNCSWISSNGTTCTLYSDSNGITSSTDGTVFEKISPTDSPSSTCPFQDMQSISTSTWEHYVKNETPMTSQTSCYMKHDNFLNQEIDRKNGLLVNVNNELMAQSESTNNYLKKHNENVGTITTDIRNLQMTNSSLEGFAIQTTDNLYNQTLEMETNSTNEVILWIFITIIVITMNYLLLVDPDSKYSMSITGIISIVVIIILLIIGILRFVNSEKN